MALMGRIEAPMSLNLDMGRRVRTVRRQMRWQMQHAIHGSTLSFRAETRLHYKHLTAVEAPPFHVEKILKAGKLKPDGTQTAPLGGGYTIPSTMPGMLSAISRGRRQSSLPLIHLRYLGSVAAWGRWPGLVLAVVASVAMH
jgi:hypothetical protein